MGRAGPGAPKRSEMEREGGRAHPHRQASSLLGTLRAHCGQVHTNVVMSVVGGSSLYYPPAIEELQGTPRPLPEARVTSGVADHRR